MKMARRCGTLIWNFAGGTTIFMYFVLIFYVSYRVQDIYRVTLFTQNTTTTLAYRGFIPRCFSSIHKLANNTPSQRLQMTIHCNNTSYFKAIIHRVTGQPTEPSRLTWKSDKSCLKNFVMRSCYLQKEHVVPNVVHYVWFGRLEFKAEHLVSFLSAVRSQQPCAILFHASELPSGPYWKLLLSIVPTVIHVARDEPSRIFGRKFGFIQHKADVVRLEVLKALGGIYLDMDQLMTRSVTELMNSSLVMSHENANNLANSMILAQPEAPFLGLWYNEYKWYNAKKWGFHSTVIPWTLAQVHNKLIKVVGNRFVNPDYPVILKFWNGYYNISTNYGLHLYTRFYPKLKLELPEVTRRNSSLGDLWRTILFDSPEHFSCPETNT